MTDEQINTEGEVIMDKMIADDYRALEKQKQLVMDLTGFWYSMLVGHHKERDAHFFIEVDYRYDGQELITVYHNGYIDKDWSHTVISMKEAYDVMETELRRQIMERISWCKQNEDYEDFDPEVKEKEYHQRFNNYWEEE